MLAQLENIVLVDTQLLIVLLVLTIQSKEELLLQTDYRLQQVSILLQVLLNISPLNVKRDTTVWQALLRLLKIHVLKVPLEELKEGESLRTAECVRLVMYVMQRQQLHQLIVEQEITVHWEQ